VGFFSEATINGLQSIISRGDLIRKINFPKYIIVISGTISALINLCINLLVVFAFILINGVSISFESILIIPLVMELYAFCLAVAFLLAAANVKLRDIGYLWEIFLQAFFYATPILYPLGMVITQSKLAAKLIMLNPVAQVIQDARYVLVTHDSVSTYQLFGLTWKMFIPFIIVIVSITVAALYFKNNSKNFAENI